MKRLLIHVLPVLVLVQCNGNFRSYRKNSEEDKKEAKKVVARFFDALKKNDVKTFESEFDALMKKEIPGFKDMLKEREASWGKLHEYSFDDVATYVVNSSKGDTVQYEVYVHTIYDFGEGYDRVSYESIGKNPLKIIGYDFTAFDMFDRSQERLEEIQKQYQSLAEAVINGEKTRVMKYCEGDESYANDVLSLPRKVITKGARVKSIEILDGFMHEIAGKTNEGWGTVPYLVYTDKGDTCIVIMEVLKNRDDNEYFLDYIYVGPSVFINNKSDLEFLETMVKGVVEMINSNDVEKLHAYMHDDIKQPFDDMVEELESILKQYKSYGAYDSMIHSLTLRTDDELYLNAWAVASFGEHKLEMHFKPDETGNYKIYAIKPF